MKYDVQIYLPDGLTKAGIAKCLQIIKNGQAVDFPSAAKQLPVSMYIAIVRTRKEIVAVGAIKAPRRSYASKVAKESGYAFDIDMLEVGYIAREASHRGHNLSRLIVEKLALASPRVPLFATTSNEKMKKTLKAAGFLRQGKEWNGKQKNILSLWIKQAGSR